MGAIIWDVDRLSSETFDHPNRFGEDSRLAPQQLRGNPMDCRALRPVSSARLKSSDSNHGHIGVGQLLRQFDLQPTFYLSKSQRLPTCQQMGGEHFHVQPIYI